MQTSLPFSDSPAPSVALDTRRQAHQDSKIHAGGQRQSILRFIRRRGRLGSTDAEAAAATGLIIDSARARRVELRDAGLVIDSGNRRPSPSGRQSTVWVARETSGQPAGRITAPATIGQQQAESQAPVISAEISARAPWETEAAARKCSRCRSENTVEVSISGGRTRLDCAVCGRFVAWGRW